MNHYGYITDNTYEVSITALTWNFVKHNEDGSTTDFLGIESTVQIDDGKVVMLGSPQEFNAWRYEFPTEEDI